MIKKIVITGAPSTGKTSLINKLKEDGFSCVQEISRDIIRQQIEIDGDALPWKNILSFSHQVARLRKAQFKNSTKNTIHFFDRGLIDVVAYMNIDCLRIPNSISKFLDENRYYKDIFLTPVWEDIFENDRERKEGLKKSIKIEKEIVKCYKSYNYNIIEIPKYSLEERVKFILSQIKD